MPRFAVTQFKAKYTQKMKAGVEILWNGSGPQVTNALSARYCGIRGGHRPDVQTSTPPTTSTGYRKHCWQMPGSAEWSYSNSRALRR
jgi:hypothetical protein